VFLEEEEVRRGMLGGKKREEGREKGEEKKKEKRKRKASILLLPLRYDLVCILVGTPSQFDSDCCSRLLHRCKIHLEIRKSNIL
jgi:hypothetical protein